MNTIIFNHDGSIKNLELTDIIVQGNNLVDAIYCAIEGYSNDEYTAGALFTLPDGSITQLQGETSSFNVDGSTYQGYKFLLTSAETAFSGIVKMSLSLVGQDLERAFSVNVNLTINESGYLPNYTNITMSQYENLVSTIATLQPKYVLNNARTYTSVANAEADLENLAYYQVIIIADPAHPETNPALYFKNQQDELVYLNDIGQSVTSVSLDEVSSSSSSTVYRLHFTLTSGEEIETDNFTVYNGVDGADGADGADGVSVTDVKLNAANEFITTLSNGNTINSGSISAGKLYRHVLRLLAINAGDTASAYLILEIYDTKEGDYSSIDEFLTLHPSERFTVNGAIPDSSNNLVQVSSIEIEKNGSTYEVHGYTINTNVQQDGLLSFPSGLVQTSYDDALAVLPATKLYLHTVQFPSNGVYVNFNKRSGTNVQKQISSGSSGRIRFTFISNSSTAITTISDLIYTTNDVGIAGELKREIRDLRLCTFYSLNSDNDLVSVSYSVPAFPEATPSPLAISYVLLHFSTFASGGGSVDFGNIVVYPSVTLTDTVTAL